MPRLKCDCGRNVSYQPDQAGEKIRCPGCKKSLIVPDDDEDEDDEDEEEEKEPEKKPSDRKRGAGRKSQPSGTMYSLGSLFFSAPGAVMILVIITIASGLLAYGIYESKISSGAKSEPTKMTYAQLLAGGNRENSHVLLTDFRIGVNYIYTLKLPKSEQEKAASNPQGLPWQTVYVPIFPTTNPMKDLQLMGTTPILSDPPPATEVRGLLLLPDVRNEPEMSKILKDNKVQGLVAPATKRLDADTAAEIRKLYNGIDLDQVLVLEEGRKPTSAVLTILLIILGGLFLLVALVMGIIGFLYRPR